MNDQDKVIEAMRRHMDFMKYFWTMLMILGCMVLIAGGYFFFLKTDGHFGDVPMGLGIYWMYKLISA